MSDLAEAMVCWRLWWALAWQDLRRRYRGSILGPLWITFTMGATIGAIGLVYSQLFAVDRDDYLPFLCAGIVLWNLLIGLTNDGCTAYIEAHGMIRQARLPLSLFVLRSVCRNVLLFGHHLIILVLVAAMFPVTIAWATPLALLGLAAFVFNGVWAGLLLGVLCARFRDVPPIVASVLQVAFFVTPVIWHPDLLEHRRIVIDLNPFHHYLAVVRDPLLGQLPPAESWAVVGLTTLGGWALALAVFGRYRRRLVFWV